jgi:hypothetical protein
MKVIQPFAEEDPTRLGRDGDRDRLVGVIGQQ